MIALDHNWLRSTPTMSLKLYISNFTTIDPNSPADFKVSNFPSLVVEMVCCMIRVPVLDGVIPDPNTSTSASLSSSQFVNDGAATGATDILTIVVVVPVGSDDKNGSFVFTLSAHALHIARALSDSFNEQNVMYDFFPRRPLFKSVQVQLFMNSIVMIESRV